ncbi:MAG: Rieske 2Fe-2S domain-containing protein [Actinomycetota bacterium]|nr:Rieske 2Fe-2S domain-containing protein [Actinomycetota bacterium]
MNRDPFAGEWMDNEHPALRRCWHPVARVGDLDGDGPLAVTLLGEHWCIVRLGGRLTALPDTCPHRLAPLSAGTVVGDTLQCAYHGYRFDADGTCVDIPALAPGTPIPSRAGCGAAHGVVEHLGLLWLAPEEPLVDLPEVPEHTDPSFVHCPLPVVEWKAGAAQMTDNFLDVGHLAFLHLATFGSEGDRRVGDYDVDRDGWRFSVRYKHLSKALGDSHHPGEDFRTVERESWFIYTPPHHVWLRLSYPDEAAILTISFCHQPVDATTTRLYCTDYRNDIADEPDAIAEAVAFQLAVAAEDQAMLEQIRRPAVPLDVTGEFHSKADRITLEMRRTLRRLADAATSETAPT